MPCRHDLAQIRGAHSLTTTRQGYAVLHCDVQAKTWTLVGYTPSPRHAVATAVLLTSDHTGPGERFEAHLLDVADRLLRHLRIEPVTPHARTRPQWVAMTRADFGHPPAPPAASGPLTDPLGTASLLELLPAQTDRGGTG